jgi:hypothetical protein
MSVAFRSLRRLALFESFSVSLVADFFIRSTGKGHVNVALTAAIPVLESGGILAQTLRVIRLNCLTIHYAPLWAELWDDAFRADAFTKDDPRLASFSGLTSTWTRASALRNDYERRQALVELDVLAALALDIGIDELCTIYRVQFPVLVGYERENRYDQRGRLVPTAVKNLVRQSGQQEGEVQDPEQPGRSYLLPFDRCDREEDMRRAYDVFIQRRAGRGAA